MPLNGKLLIDDSIAVLPPGCEFRFSGQGRVDWYTVYIPSVSLALPDNIVGELGSADVTAVNRQLLKRLKSTLGEVFAVASSRSAAEPTECVAATIHDHFISAFRRILEESVESKRPAERKVEVNRKALISQVIELINDASAWEMSVPKLASLIGVSQRTLLTAFREQLGTTPQNYLIAHRYHLARRWLMKGAAHDTTVAAVAAKFGFFDLGRFAGRYLMMFGEHPSESLRRRV